MELIDKSTVVAEIEELDEFWHLSKSPDGQAFIESLLSFLDNIEVKEVDLEEEMDFVKDAYYYFTSDERDSMMKVARYFFELGMQQSKKDNNDEEKN